MQIQALAEEPHPYYPADAVIRGYVANEYAVLVLLAAFAVIITAVLGLVDRFLIWSRPGVGYGERYAAAWFALCGFLHVFFEGYYVLHRYEVASLNTLFAQLWKEYSLSDSRYLLSDTFTVCVETITVLCLGPLSWMTVTAIIRSSPSRHGLQVMVCMAHLYGVTLYYSTNWLETWQNGTSYSRPEFLYYWVYYVGFNLPWAIVPLGLLLDSFTQIRQAFIVLQNTEKRTKKE